MTSFNKPDFIIGGIAIAVLICCLSNGMGLMFDSHLYLNGSNYIDEFGLSNLFTEVVFQAKPPLFPLFLYVLGNNVFLVAISNVVFFALSLGISFYLINQVVTDEFFNILAKGLFALGTPIIMIHEFLLPEAFFMFLWSLHLLLVYETIKRPLKTRFFLLIVSGIIMIGLRHIGIVLVFTSGLFLWYHLRSSSSKLLTIANLILPLLLFMLWQYLLYTDVGHFRRMDHFSGLDIIGNLSQVFTRLGRWFIPNTGILTLDLIVSLALIVFMVWTISLAIRKLESKTYGYFLIILVPAFLAFIILKGDLLNSDIERYLSIVYLPVILLFVKGLNQFQIKYDISQKLVVMLSLIWCVYPLVRLINNVLLWSGL